MRKITLLVALLAITLSGFGQLIKDLPSLYIVDSTHQGIAEPAKLPSSYISSSELPTGNPMKPSLLKDAKVSLEVGSSFSTFGSGRNLFTTYLSPSVSFQPSNKVEVFVGAYVAHNNANGFGDSEVLQVAEPVAGYTGATYFLNDRMNFFGNGTYGRGGSLVVPYGVNNDYKSVSVGVSYKISEKASVSAQFQWSQGLPPYGTNFWSNPFSGYHSNFGSTSLFEPNRP